MGQLTPQILRGIEDRMSVLSEEGFAWRSRDLWWNRVATERSSTGRKEFLTWFINNVVIRDLGSSAGNLSYSDLAAVYMEIENKFHGEGFKVAKAELEDSDGGGMNSAASWAKGIGAYMAYYPQKQVAHVLKNGHTASLYTGYDGKALFASDHPLNPADTSVGTFANILTGSASGIFPGACPIQEGVTADVALTNLAKVQAYIESIAAPNGVDPRGLRGVKILCGPKLFPRVVQLTNAKILAQAAATGGGGADVEALIESLGYGQPVKVPELAGFESDTTYFVVAEGVAPTEIGPIVYQNREAFRMDNYGPMTDADLGRKQEFEWQVHGRNAVAPGHPFLIFKCQAT